MNKLMSFKAQLIQFLDILLLGITIFAVILAFRQNTSPTIDLIINGAFLGVLGLQFLLADKKSDFFKSNIWDVFIVLALNAPILRLLRLVKVFRLFVFVRKIKFKNIVHFIRITNENIMGNLALVLSLVFIFAGIEWWVEHGVVGTMIHDYQDALWWAFSTVVAVGYGDVYPVTNPGRLIAAFLMVFGIILWGIFVSNITALIVEEAQVSKEVVE